MVEGKGRNDEDSFSNKAGGRIASSEWHGAMVSDNHPGYKASFYVMNFSDNLPLFRLRQAFEVCGILSDVFVARHRNARGQEFGFVRYVNVKNENKLSQALNNVWIGECRVWAREARYDRFAHNDSIVGIPKEVVRKETAGVRPVRVQKGEGVNKIRLVTKGLEKQIDGESMVRIGKVEVPVGGGGKKPKVRRVNEGDGGVLAMSREEGKGKDVNVKVVAEAGFMKSQQQSKVKVKERVQANATAVNSNAPFHFVPVYNSAVEDRKWVTSCMIATVHVGDSVVALQQRVEDAGFPYVVVTPMGGARV